MPDFYKKLKKHMKKFRGKRVYSSQNVLYTQSPKWKSKREQKSHNLTMWQIQICYLSQNCAQEGVSTPSCMRIGSG